MDRKTNRTAVLFGAIKFFSVDEGALIIHFNRVGVLRLVPSPIFHDLVLQAVWQRGYVLLFAIVDEEFLAVGFILLVRGFHFFFLFSYFPFCLLSRFLHDAL